MTESNDLVVRLRSVGRESGCRWVLPAWEGCQRVVDAYADLYAAADEIERQRAERVVAGTSREWLERLITRVDAVREDLLFGEDTSVTDAATLDKEAQAHVLTALAHLDIAKQSLRLALCRAR